MASYLPTLHPVGVLVVLAMPVKITSWLPTLSTYSNASGIGYASKTYLKWLAIQLAIHSIVGEYIDYRCRCMSRRIDGVWMYVT